MATSTPPFLLTIISLVLAVSGATYAALVAIRSYLQESVREASGASEKYNETIKSAKDGETKAKGDEKYAWVQWWIRVWNWSFGIPIAAFALVIFPFAFYASTQDILSQYSAWAWLFFQWLIRALVVLDVTSIACGVYSYSRIKVNLSDLKSSAKSIAEAQFQPPSPKALFGRTAIGRPEPQPSSPGE